MKVHAVTLPRSYGQHLEDEVKSPAAKWGIPQLPATEHKLWTSVAVCWENSIIREAVYPGDSKKHYKANLKPIISSLDMAQKWAQMTLIVSHNDSFVTLSQLSGGLAAGRQSTLSSLSPMSTQSPTVHCQCTTAANTLVCHQLWPLATWTLTYGHLNFPTAAPYGGQCSAHSATVCQFVHCNYLSVDIHVSKFSFLAEISMKMRRKFPF